MARVIRVGAAQLGPTGDNDSREAVVARMICLLDSAIEQGCDLVAFPELALTPYFPKAIIDSADRYFETSMPNQAVQPLFDRAKEAGVSFYMGYAEQTSDGRQFNTAILVDETGEIVQRYRKIHLPGLPAGRGKALVYEPHYFEAGEEGFNTSTASGTSVGMALCQDRRYPETFRVLALKGAEIVLMGYNTPVLPQSSAQHELAMCSGAYANGLFVVGIAKAGIEGTTRLLGGSCIIDPHGQIIARASSDQDELTVATLDFGELERARAHWNFFARRRPEFYGNLVDPVSDADFVTSSVTL